VQPAPQCSTCPRFPPSCAGRRVSSSSRRHGSHGQQRRFRLRGHAARGAQYEAAARPTAAACSPRGATFGYHNRRRHARLGSCATAAGRSFDVTHSLQPGRGDPTAGDRRLRPLGARRPCRRGRCGVLGSASRSGRGAASRDADPAGASALAAQTARIPRRSGGASGSAP
jgi:hypothetical protein